MQIQGGQIINKAQQGAFWEEAVACYLERAGVRIIERNFRCSQGEIDLIGDHRGCLVFFEVKYRKNADFGLPEEAVNGRKQEKISRCADYYLYTRLPDAERSVRFDVVAVCGDRLNWIKDAFAYRRKGRWK